MIEQCTCDAYGKQFTQTETYSKSGTISLTIKGEAKIRIWGYDKERIIKGKVHFCNTDCLSMFFDFKDDAGIKLTK